MSSPKKKPSRSESKQVVLPPPVKAKRGRPQYEPTPDQRKIAEGMSGYGATEDDIARVMHISPTTLRKYFRDELDTGMIKANAAVATALFRRATGNSPQAVTAQIWWTKTRMGWKETVVSEVSGVIETISRTMSARDAADNYAKTRRNRSPR